MRFISEQTFWTLLVLLSSSIATVCSIPVPQGIIITAKSLEIPRTEARNDPVSPPMSSDNNPSNADTSDDQGDIGDSSDDVGVNVGIGSATPVLGGAIPAYPYSLLQPPYHIHPAMPGVPGV